MTLGLRPRGEPASLLLNAPLLAVLQSLQSGILLWTLTAHFCAQRGPNTLTHGQLKQHFLHYQFRHLHCVEVTF